MKHYLLTLPIAFLSATASMAQTTPETALTVKEGTNSYTVEGDKSQTVYWKFTADKNYIAAVSPLEGSYNTPTVGTEFTTNADTNVQELVGMKNASIKYPQCGYPFKKGVTYYIANTGYNGDTGFQLALTEDDNINGGVTADAPVELTVGKNTYVGDPYNNSYGYSAYASYSATESGMLTVTSSSYMNASVNGVQYTSNYVNNSYSFSFGVTDGEKYSITFNNLYQPIFVKADISHPTEGSVDMPFTGKDGANTLPADYGKYYYSYTPQTTGFLTVSSDTELPGGTVAIYDSKTSSTPLATSEQGTFNVRTEVAYTGTTYYIVVDKVDGTDADETFNISMEAYKAGEKESNPIVVENLPATETLEAAKGTFYYAVSVPANTSKFLTVKAEGDTDEYTTVSVYPEGNSWGGINGSNYVQLNVNNTYDTRYIIKWTTNESKPLSFTVAFKDIEAGDIITNPIQAVSGNNSINSNGTKYYQYTATRDGKLSVELSDPEMSVSFPRGTGQYDGTYDPIISGITYSLEAESGVSYLITINNAKQGESFTLSETDFQIGETRENPITVEGNEYTIGKDQNNCWLKYTATKECQLTVDCDAPYNDNGSNQVYFGKENESMTGMVATRQDGSSYDNYFHGTKVLKAGEAILVHVQLTGNVEGYKVTFAEGELPEGMSVSKPYTVKVGETVSLPSNTTVWVKADVTKGENVFVATASVRTILYSSLEDAQNETNGEYINYDTQYDENWNPICTLKKTFDEDATVYFQIVGSYNDYTFTFQSDGKTTGINGIGNSTSTKTEVFGLNGVKIADSTNGLANGVYILRQNGKAKKIVIK